MLQRLPLFLLLTLLSTACSVYTPLHTPAPLIDGPQQVEISGGFSTPGSLQGAVTYSPVRHVLLRAVYGRGSGDGSTSMDSVTQPNVFRAEQLEAALGTYWRPSPKVLLGGFAGYGRSTGEHWYLKRSGVRGVLFQPGPDSVWAYQYQARYQHFFAEAYTHFLSVDKSLSMGLGYRVNYVRFNRYTNAGAPVDFGRMWRHEPALFARLGGDDPDNWVNGQLAIGYSFSPGFTMTRERAGNRDITEVRKPLPSFSLSVMVRPDVLWQQLRRP